MINLVQAKTASDLSIIETLAHTIWHEHYITIISLEQIEYMLDKFNTVKTMTERMQKGVLFYYMTYDDMPVGYIAIEKDPDFIYISKLYVLKSYRGKKIAKTAMQFAESLAKDEGKESIKLHVNKYNTNSISAYEKMGFVNTEDVVTDIGRGFIMDDYLMVKWVNS